MPIRLIKLEIFYPKKSKRIECHNRLKGVPRDRRSCPRVGHHVQRLGWEMEVSRGLKVLGEN